MAEEKVDQDQGKPKSKMPPARVYIEKWLKIRTKEGNVVPLKLNDPQRRLMDEV